MKSIVQAFDGYTFAIVLSTGHSYEQRKDLRQKITSRGGKISYLVTKQCHFLVLSDVQLQKDSTATRTATRYGIPVVPVHFLDVCIAEGKVVDFADFTDHGAGKSNDPRVDENFTKGVVVVDPVPSTRRTSRIQKPLKVWPYLDPDGPLQFHSNPYQVAKFVLLINKECAMRRGEIPFCVLEIQVASDENSDPRFCVHVNTGSLNVQKRDNSLPEMKGATNKAWTSTCRYCNDATQALDTYAKLHKTYTSPPQSMVKWDSKDTDVDIPSSVGSPQFQKIVRSWLIVDKAPDDCVAELVSHLWAEAVGKLDAVLSIKVGALSSDKIEKADGLLHEIQKRLDSGQSDNDDVDVQGLAEEFYDLVPQKNVQPLTNKAAVVRQHELVQLIRDIVSTSEAIETDEPKDSVVAQHSALDCHVAHVSPDGQEFAAIGHMVLTSQRGTDIQIKNIFKLRRPLEEATFRHDVPNKRLLFHASSVRNYVGILSRGLLLPKLVATDGGHGPGDLGRGIYFSCCSSTSARYARASGTKRTRLMLVARVALGECLETRVKMLHLKQPPEGFQSVHAVKSTEEDPSDFEDDEYIIFRSDQQQLEYLVEFTLPDDDLRCPPLTALPKVVPKAVGVDRPLAANVPKIEDLRDIPFEANCSRDEQYGLQSTDNLPAFLRSVHVRAALVDLAAKVVVMQEYTNKSSVPIEAKYVFPLDDMGAVCGFEAFINGKHVVGTIEEKRRAHHTYRKAVAEGHGAYLMDQETPDVFVVFVGNLPAGAEVLIKITYVTELATEGELISFCLPGSVAPWQKGLASMEQTMDHFVTVGKGQTKETSLEISIEMPFEIRSLISTSHRILYKKTATKSTVKLVDTDDLDRQFQLLIGLAEIHVPRMWVERHPDKGTEACMLTFYPTFESEQPESGTVVFLLDSSNSMRSGAFGYAQAIALLCLHHLHVSWSFNIVAFGSVYEELFPVPRQKSQESVKLAEDFILGLTSNRGNTRLSFSLQQHFLLPTHDSDHVQSVFLISDGHVTDSGQELLDQAAKHYNVCRIFTLGVDTKSVPCNRYLMKSLAARGAGAFERFDEAVKTNWEVKIKSLLKKAAQPVLTHVSVEWQQLGENATEPVQAPRHTATVFHGARHVIYGFVSNCTVATLHAKVNGKEMSTVVSTSELGKTCGKLLHTLTAKAIITDWEDGILHTDRTKHEGLKALMKRSIISMSKEFSLLTSVTSFIAVEKRDSSVRSSVRGPSVMDVVQEEAVDQLVYIAYEGDISESVVESAVASKKKKTKAARMAAPEAQSKIRTDLLEFEIQADKEEEIEMVKLVCASSMNNTREFYEAVAASPQDSEGKTSSSLGRSIESAIENAKAFKRSLETEYPRRQLFASQPQMRQQKNAERICAIQPSPERPTTQPGVGMFGGQAFGTPLPTPQATQTFSFGSGAATQATSLFGAPPPPTNFVQSPTPLAVTGSTEDVAPQQPKQPEEMHDTKLNFRAYSICCSGVRYWEPRQQEGLPSTSDVNFPPLPTPQQGVQKPKVALLLHEKHGLTSRKAFKAKRLSFWEPKDESPVVNTQIEPRLLNGAQFGLTKDFGNLPLVSSVLAIIEQQVPEKIKKLLKIEPHLSITELKKKQTEIAEQLDMDSDDDDVTSSSDDDDVKTITVNQMLSLGCLFTGDHVAAWLDCEKMIQALNSLGVKSLGDTGVAILPLCVTLATILCVINTFVKLRKMERNGDDDADDLKDAVRGLISCITPPRNNEESSEIRLRAHI